MEIPVNSILYFAPKSRYQEKYDESVAQRDQVRKKTALISNLRLLTVAGGITGMVIAYRAGNYPAAGGCAAVTVVLFALLALRHGKLFRLTDELSALARINNASIKHKWPCALLLYLLHNLPHKFWF